MASFNKVILMGHLTRDPERKTLPSGTVVCDFGLAVNRRWRDTHGDPHEEVLFIDGTAFGKTAEAINQYFKKGNPILIEGRLKLDTWDDEAGAKRTKIRFIVERFSFVAPATVGTTKDAAKSKKPAKRAGRSKAAAPLPLEEQNPEGGFIPEEDIPF